jgi:chemotaxis protein MotA
MLFIIGMVTVFGCVALGFAMHHGNFGVLWQPNEFIIIGGAAIGALIISNPKHTIKAIGGGFKKVMKGSPYQKADYIDLLMFLFGICKLMKTKGMLQIEPALDNPHESELFTKFPKFVHNHHAVEFFCDYFRMVTMGMDNHYQLEDLMDKEIEQHHHEAAAPGDSINAVADGLPALGIVAAVLGVIQTMGSIAEPPEILGGLIGAALVGTFMGVLMGYGLVGPIAACIGKFANAETEYFHVMKAAIISHIQGNAPVVTVEFARKIIPSHLRPTFVELDAMINAAPSA